MKTKEIIKLIEADGWFEVRQKGSHRQFKHPVKKGLVTVPVHRLSNDLTPGLERSILKQAQLEKN
ncbi:type II toxin-antitoxin system HicA family toxin [Agriterribacter sp.]|uniref:type II toxin-antitoxin system HicA family toxin n=1 Tax=Agriterribacter sp. TaxID=2821509 RepID=UPI002C21B08B|nr:type II toxin-antitoxin system HicA family toxin [Agriterribacter sp.]HTN06290.1 type II toxin-antitoxin system HicA family toxin [Agriterribacter sp.]